MTAAQLPAFRGILVAGLSGLIAFGALACDEPRSSARPSSSLLEVEFTPRPTQGGSSEASEEPTDGPTFLAIPVGWEAAFCAVFADVVVAQELAVDIERAIEEENARDARLLARDLRDTTAEATTLLAELPDWEPAQDAKEEMTALIDMGTRAGAEYGTGFTEESEEAIRRARRIRRDMAQAAPGANESFAELETLGITCEGLPLRIEEF